MDYKLFELINGLAGKNSVLDLAGLFFGVYLIYLFAIFVAFISIDKKFFRYALVAFSSSVIGRLGIVEIIKRAVDRPRPYEILNAHLLVQDTERGLSFSSGHTVILFCIAFSFYKTRYFYPLVILAIVGSVARIFIGVHYPSDIAASIAIAAAVVWLLKRLFKKPVLG